MVAPDRGRDRGAMSNAPSSSRHSGYTLVELLAVLTVLGILLAIATPAVRRTIDRHAVIAARNAVAMELARARLLARAHGGAVLVLDAVAGAVSIRSSDGDTLASPAQVLAVYDARIDLGGADSAAVTYDRLGIGRMASRTVRLVRHDADARLTISSYGRVRLW
ncbi:MAG TPA: prepilin-type N-terminal cleavage/methylation domain-containing protein [Longimicrobiales bacterium]|nr:prepilin-type N-terminal cleavage/methylation domain-containing protein [Longimicrobiales bacterium]